MKEPQRGQAVSAMSGDLRRIYGWQLAGRVIPQFLAFGISIAMVRLAGVVAIGEYAVTVAAVSICVGLIWGALDTDLLRRQDSDLAPLVVVAKLFLWVCAVPVVLVFLRILEVPLFGGFAIYAGLFFFQVAETSAVASRLSNDDYSSIAPRVLCPLVFLVTMVLWGTTTFEQIGGAFLLSWLIAPLVTRIRWGALRISSGWSRIKNLLYAARGIVGILLFTQIYGNADLLILKLIVGDTAAGEYRIAQAFAAVLMPAIGVLAFVYLSRARIVAAAGETQALRSLCGQQLLLHVIIGISVVLIMAALLPWAVPVLYGAGGVSAIGPAIVLSAAAALNATAMVFVYTLLAMNRDRLVLWGTAVAATANVVLNIGLVPLFGTIGAASASVSGFLIMIVVLWRMTERVLQERTKS